MSPNPQKNSLLLHNLGARWSKCSKICSWRSFGKQTKAEPFLFLARIHHQYLCDKRKRSPPKGIFEICQHQKLLTCMREKSKVQNVLKRREDFESKQENPKSMLLPLMLVSSLLIFPAAFPELSLQTTIPNSLLSIPAKCPFSKHA